jgi:exosome complex component CSL4
LPGDELSVIEEFSFGKGAYQLEGYVRSEVIGTTEYNRDSRKVDVQKITKELILPYEGLEVVAEVGSVMRRDARVDIFMIGDKLVTVPYTGVVHISDVDNRRVNDMGSVMRNGDIIKAKIINTKNKIIQLSISGAEYGTIYAYCSKCGNLLRVYKGRVHCSKCNRFERRKITKTYGKEELV